MKSLVERIEGESDMVSVRSEWQEITDKAHTVYQLISGKLVDLDELDEVTSLDFDEWDDEWQAVVAGELGRDPTPDEFQQLQSLLLSEYLHAIGRA